MTDAGVARRCVEQFYDRLEAREFDSAGELLATDVVYELPQTQEQICGRDAYLHFNREYPGDWHLSRQRIVVESPQAAVWLRVRVGSEVSDNLALITFDDQDLICRVVDFWPEAYAPPADRPSYVESTAG